MAYNSGPGPVNPPGGKWWLDKIERERRAAADLESGRGSFDPGAAATERLWATLDRIAAAQKARREAEHREAAAENDQAEAPA